MPLVKPLFRQAMRTHSLSCVHKNYLPSSKQTKVRSRRCGQSLIETLAGFMLLIPLGLFSYDLTYILAANQNNENLAENAARAAANHGDLASAKQAAQLAVDDFKKSSTFNNINLTNFSYNLGSGEINLTTEMVVTLPVPFASWTTMTINAQSLQTIVGTPAAL